MYAAFKSGVQVSPIFSRPSDCTQYCIQNGIDFDVKKQVWNF